MSGDAVESEQDAALATYEGWCRGKELRINWHNPVDGGEKIPAGRFCTEFGLAVGAKFDPEDRA